MVELRQVRYFIAVAEELHFGRAAERLQMSQPPLSQAIMRLEQEVGARLFERTKRVVSLTSAGAAFLNPCRELIRRADAVSALPGMVADGLIGSLRFGAVASAFEWPLPAVFDALRKQHPNIGISAEEIDSREAVLALRDGRLDVALVRLGTVPAGLRAVHLSEDRFFIAAPVEHALASAAGPVRLADLADEDWVWLPREVSPEYHDAMAAACHDAGFSANAAHWARSIASQLKIVECGLGIALVPESSAGLAAGTHRRPLTGTAVGIGLSLLVREDDPLGRRVLPIAELVRRRSS
ncbi:LysR family transcriptional regulator [Curtobacterium flaccumfaciens]|uniref:LysR family transcriptional regulator n=1 Tax=Curtobacterium flaccumfaciens TaxID=2035 RepID=UPI001BDDD703|nr:LysR substrate-binding domain-containing protein [Curtobacterium flaccumfaciens]MBT1631573.1 LysR family transcriptional regulator [Curtobacterium flaccumfaciens pv. oortii]MCX2847016.1 LysR substrate-binding domain-containing protein [Curtobacterium flaccumfaciens pv. oortii]